jgi:hypothetical protein
MAETAPQLTEPPKLRPSPDGSIDMNSLADLVEWFLNFDERVARMRHPMVNELFFWKQSDDEANNLATYPFENAEARFALGVIQAVSENNSESLMKLWITDVLNALHESRQTREDITETYKLDAAPADSHIEKAKKLTTNTERRLYLSSCWLEALCTAEARVLGWIYQERYGRPYTA